MGGLLSIHTVVYPSNIFYFISNILISYTFLFHFTHTWVSRIKLSSLKSPILITRQSFLLRIVMIALWLNMIVLLLFLGLDNLEKTRPTTKAWMMHPRTAWRETTIMASVQCVVVCRDPYPIVCCVSRENRKQDPKPSQIIVLRKRCMEWYGCLITLIEIAPNYKQ